MTRLLLLALASLAAGLIPFHGTASGLDAGAPADGHYDVAASIDPHGRLQSTVEISFAQPQEAFTFILGNRFHVEGIKSGDGDEVETQTEQVDRPVPNLKRVTVSAPEAIEKLEITYSGPLDSGQGAHPFTEDRVELVLDHIWFPVREDLAMRFSSRATIIGLDPDLQVVAQGGVERLDDGTVVLARDYPDVDLPMVAVRGLTMVAGPGVEVYAADHDRQLAGVLTRHAIRSGAWMQNWFGALPRPIRLAIVPRDRGSAYARAGYTVVAEGPDSEREYASGEVPEFHPARHIAHEFAHAWWAPVSAVSEDYWMAESIAEYVALRYIEHAFDEEAVAVLVERWREGARDAGPVLGHGRPTGAQLYRRGPLLLRELEQRIGTQRMDQVLARIARETPRDTEQFLDVLAEVAGDAAAEAFERAMRS